MIDLKTFRKSNNLTQDELGLFLGMKKSFISKIENGKEKLPQQKLQKLLDNPNGWDTSSLVISDFGGSNNVIGNHNAVNQAEVINKLVDELAALRRQNDELISIIKNMVSK